MSGNKLRVVAPDVERSSAGHSITSSRPLSCKRTAHLPVEAYRVNGTDYRSRQRQLGTQTGGSESWAKAIQGSPCIVLLEDIDGVFWGREPKGDPGLTFDALLNAIDGIQQDDGVLLFITTNHPAAIDDALGAPIPGTNRTTRPGRLDYAIALPPLDYAGRLKMAVRIVGGLEAERLAAAHLLRRTVVAAAAAEIRREALPAKALHSPGNSHFKCDERRITGNRTGSR
jgi:hypothetical protein